MDPHALEVVVREVAFIAVLITGGAVMAGIACITVAWAIKAMLRMFGLTNAFLGFARTRRRNK